jgi:hypothetical protein
MSAVTVVAVPTPRDADDWKAVETVQDFAAYLEILAVDFDVDRRKIAHDEAEGWTHVEGRWAHRDSGAFLEAWAAWQLVRISCATADFEQFTASHAT